MLVLEKSFGFSCAYQMIFCFIFHNENWFRLLESKKSDSLPSKNTDYRFF
jgi:hypothetical protein